MTEKQIQREIRAFVKAITKARAAIGELKLEYAVFRALKVPDDFGIDELADPLLSKLEKTSKGLIEKHQEIENYINGNT